MGDLGVLLGRLEPSECREEANAKIRAALFSYSRDMNLTKASKRRSQRLKFARSLTPPREGGWEPKTGYGEKGESRQVREEKTRCVNFQDHLAGVIVPYITEFQKS